jgi:hypothetical protein
MDTASALLALAAAMVLGFHVGMHWAPDAIWSAVFGAVAGELCAGAYWGLALLLATAVPDADVSAHAVGLDFLILVIATPVCGAITGILGYRRMLPPR